VTGSWTAASIVAIPGQNVTAGDFDALTAALGSNTAYANIHTVKFPAGEIRGQMRQRDRDDRD
jgi:CHRD domain